jgi:hypothetical protein
MMLITWRVGPSSFSHMGPGLNTCHRVRVPHHPHHQAYTLLYSSRGHTFAQLELKMVSFALHAQVLTGRPDNHNCKFRSLCGRGSWTRPSRPLVPCRAGDESSNGAGKSIISEDVLERLRAAEAEAARLRNELAAAKAESPTVSLLPTNSCTTAFDDLPNIQT